MRTSTFLLCHLLGLGLGLGLGGCGGAAAGDGAPGEETGLRVRRGDFARRLLLAGELEAESGVDLVVPRTPSRQVEVRRIAEDGAAVEAGEAVVELDNSAFAADLEDKRLQAAESAHQLARRRAELESEAADRAFRVEEAKAAVEKAEIEASVPAEVVSRREHEEAQLALERARLDLGEAEEGRSAQRAAAAAETGQLELDLARLRREIATAEESIERLVLRAPRAGAVVLAEHPWEGRKIQEGDTVWVGMPLARLPDPGALVVEARLSDVDDGRLEPGVPVTCTPDAYPDRSLPGRVAKVGAVAREEAGESLRRFFAVEVELPGEPPRSGEEGLRLRPGMSVKVEAKTGLRRDVLLAPRAALDLAADPPRARLAGGGEAVVELGPCSARECVIEEGLAEGTELRAAGGPE